MSRYYMLTIPRADWAVPSQLPEGILWMKGQPERGENGYEHWQVVVCTAKKCRAGSVKRKFTPSTHVEVTRSAAANEYVWKDDTCIDQALRFELGRLPLQRNKEKDWEQIWTNAKRGAIEEIPADVRVRSYKTLKQIEKDYMNPVAVERKVRVYWGPSGLGKSRRAWYEAGITAYPKSPTSIYWDGYNNHTNVVIDEFRGGIEISSVLRWLDRHPVCVECKFGACILAATDVWITSNIPPEQWYPNLDDLTRTALLRRLEVTEFTEEWVPPTPPQTDDEEEENTVIITHSTPPTLRIDLTQETIVLSDNE